MEQKSFSIIIPVYNEEEILEKSLNQLWKAVEAIYNDFEIIVVENGSKDDTYRIAWKFTKRNERIKLLHLEKPSFGDAIKEGIRKSKKEYIIIFNIDFWDINFLNQALQLLSDKDMVIGSRRLPSSQDSRSFFRRFVTDTLNLILRAIFHYPGTDTHGIKALKRNKSIPLMNACKTKYELFDTELVVRGYKRGYQLAELPVSVQEIRPSRYYSLTRVKNTFIDIFRLLFS